MYAPIIFDVKPSLPFLTALLMLHCLSIYAVNISGLSLAHKSILIIVLCCLLIFNLIAGSKRYAVVVIVETGVVLITDAKRAVEKEYSMMTSHYLSDWITLISLHQSGARYRSHLFLVRGSVDESQLREIRALLKIQHTLQEAAL